MEAIVQIVTIVLLVVALIAGVGITIVEYHQKKKPLKKNLTSRQKLAILKILVQQKQQQKQKQKSKNQRS